MADLVWTVLCKRAIAEDGTGIISLIDTVESAQIKLNQSTEEVEIPDIPIDLTLVTTWMRSDVDQPESATAKLSLVAPSGKKTQDDLEIPIKLESDARARILISVKSLPFSYGPGRYMFEIRVKANNSDTKTKWKIASKTPIELIIIPAESQT